MRTPYNAIHHAHGDKLRVAMRSEGAHIVNIGGYVKGDVRLVRVCSDENQTLELAVAGMRDERLDAAKS